MPRVTITVPGQVPQPYRFALARQEVEIGRGTHNDIVVDSESVSTQHAIMERIRGGYVLRDLGSTNGTKLDGSPLQLIPLDDGLRVELGDAWFDFSLAEDELATLAQEAATQPVVFDDPVATRAAARPGARVVVSSGRSGGNFLLSIVVVILFVIAFVAGMSVRYQRDTGRQSLVQDILHGVPAEAAETADRPAE